MNLRLILLWLAFASIIAVYLTIYDKTAARKRRTRIPESILLLIASVGGSAAMLITMKIIRHKTKHKKFMIGLPMIIVIQAAVIIGIAYFLKIK